MAKKSEMFRLRNLEDYNNFPRKGARDAWHSVDFESLIDFMISLKQKSAQSTMTKGYLSDGHFKPYYMWVNLFQDYLKKAF